MKAVGIQRGIYGGVLGGLAFGVMMAMTGVLPMIGKMVGVPTAGAGLVVHLIISAAIGASFAVLFGRKIHSFGGGLTRGLLYGAIWWGLGPLTLMPLFLGMGLGTNWNATAATSMLPSLLGHFVYGAVLGLAYEWFQKRSVGVGRAKLEAETCATD